MFTVSTDQNTIKDSGGMSFIGTSGVYPVTINFASITTSKNGAKGIAFNVTYNGNQQTIYGPNYTNNDGKYNDISVRLYNQLAIIAGLEDGDTFSTSEEVHTVGKDNEEREFEVIDELTDLPVIMHIQAEYSTYNGEIKERMNIRAFFREDGATADEIVNDGEIGKRLALVEEKYASTVSYKDGLTEEDVTAWKAARSGKGNGGSTPAPKATPKAKTRSVFKRK